MPASMAAFCCGPGIEDISHVLKMNEAHTWVVLTEVMLKNRPWFLRKKGMACTAQRAGGVEPTQWGPVFAMCLLEALLNLLPAHHEQSQGYNSVKKGEKW